MSLVLIFICVTNILFASIDRNFSAVLGWVCALIGVVQDVWRVKTINMLREEFKFKPDK